MAGGQQDRANKDDRANIVTDVQHIDGYSVK